MRHLSEEAIEEYAIGAAVPISVEAGGKIIVLR